MAFCLLGFSFAWGLFILAGLDQFELKLYDRRCAIPFPAKAAHTVIAAIDDQSIRVTGKWPWPRNYHAMFLDAMRAYNPRVIAYDLVFRSPGEHDGLFAGTATYFDDVCFAYDFRTRQDGCVIPEASQAGASKLKSLSRFALGSVENDRPGGIPQADELIMPADVFRQFGLGFVNAPRDRDGVLRRVPLVVKAGENYYPSFALFAVCRYLGADFRDVKVICAKSVDIYKGGKIIRSIPVDEHANFTVRFYDPANPPFAYMLYLQLIKSGQALLQGAAADIQPEGVDGRILLVGHTATGSMESRDVGATSVGSFTPYIEVHANAIENILNSDYLYVAGGKANWAVAAVMCVLVGLVCFMFGPFSALVGFVGLNVLFVWFNVWLFVSHGIVFGVLPVMLAGVFTYLFIIIYRLAVENRDKRFIKKAFGRYVSKSVLNELLKNPDALRQGGQKTDLSVLFADIKGFTTYCESRDPEAVVEQLNEYLDRMTRVIFQNNGTLDKYIGDCIMAIFGAPSKQLCPDHAFRAVNAAVCMLEELEDLKRQWQQRGMEVLDIGIGVNTGAMVVGNFGSSVLWDYTVIGDEVNLGARLETLTRTYGKSIVISQSTYELVKDRFECEELGLVKVKGKNREVVVFAVKGRIN